MSDKIVFSDNEKDEPHNTGYAVCWHCGKGWQAVWTANLATETLVCPDCDYRTWVPPITDTQAIKQAIEKLEDAFYELRGLQDKLTKDGVGLLAARQADLWAEDKWFFAQMLHGYLGKNRE